MATACPPVTSPPEAMTPSRGDSQAEVISIVMVAGVVETDLAGNVSSARLSIGSCSAIPQRLPALEAALVGRPLAAADGIVDDIRGTAAYRRHAALALTCDLIAELAMPPARRAA